MLYNCEQWPNFKGKKSNEKVENQVRRSYLLMLLCLWFCGMAAAQPSSNGYVFFAPGQIRAAGHGVTALHFGGGGEMVWGSGLGLGAELGIAGPKDGFGDAYIGLLSINPSFHFGKSSKVDPYATGGYSRSFGHDSAANWGNFGFGLNYWFRERAGLKVEFRDHIHRESGITAQLWEVRFGLSFK